MSDWAAETEARAHVRREDHAVCGLQPDGGGAGLRLLVAHPLGAALCFGELADLGGEHVGVVAVQ